MKRTLYLSAATGVILVAGLVHGAWTNRWGNSSALEGAIAGLDRVPLTVGDWRGKAAPNGDQTAARPALAGHWLRRYVRDADGAAVTVMLACGMPGPLS